MRLGAKSRQFAMWAAEFWQRTWHIGIVLAASVLPFTWFLTHGTFRIFGDESFGAVYDSMARHLAHGSVAVDADAISGEAFRHNGKSYAYFGPAPAVPRIVLNKLFPNLYGKWTKLSILLGAILSMVLAMAILRQLPPLLRRESRAPGRLAETVFCVAIGPASTLLFLCSRAYVHHEAIVWGAALLLLSAFLVLRYWRCGHPGLMILAGMAASLAFFTRPTAGAGALALLAGAAAGGWALARHASKPVSLEVRRVTWVTACCIVATWALSLAYNKARFGSWLESVPVRLHVQYTEKRLQHIHGSLFNWRAAPQNAASYWLFPNLALTGLFPWIESTSKFVRETDRVKYDLIEPHASVLATEPALLLLAVCGVVGAIVLACRRHSRPLILIGALAVGTATLLPVVAVSERYVHDLYPFLAVAGGLGLAWLPARPRAFAAAAAVPLVCWGVFAMSALALIFQRDIVWGIPDERRSQLIALSVLANQTREVLALKDRVLPARLETKVTLPCQEGELRVQTADRSVLRCTQKHWETLPFPEVKRFHLVLPPNWPAVLEPLVSAGKSGAADFIYIAYPAAGQVQIGYDHWGGAGYRSGAIAAAPGGSMDVTVVMDALSDTLLVSVDGKEVLRQRAHFHSWTSDEIALGVNALGGSVAPKFSGLLTPM